MFQTVRKFLVEKKGEKGGEGGEGDKGGRGRRDNVIKFQIV